MDVCNFCVSVGYKFLKCHTYHVSYVKRIILLTNGSFCVGRMIVQVFIGV